MSEEIMSSNKRIQLLRERLELYNATIAEAMGILPGGKDTERNRTSSSIADKTTSTRWAKKGSNGNNGLAPQLERNLTAEFNAARATSNTTTTATTNNSTAGAAAAAVVGTSTTTTTTTTTTTNAATGGNVSGSGASRRCERRTAPPPPSPPPPNSGRGASPLNSTTSIFCDDSSTAYSSDNEDVEFVNPFLNEPVTEEGVATSSQELQETGEKLATRTTTAVSSAISNNKKGASPNASDLRESINDDNDDSDYGASFRSSPPPAPQQKVISGGNTKAEEEKIQTEMAPPFARLETAYYKMSVVEQAILKLQRLLDIERFPGSLPQRQQALQLAETRDELLRKEQALRRKDTTGNSFTTIHGATALSIDQQVRQLLAECGATRTFFARVHERKAAVAEKEQLLKKKLSELEERQREVQEKRQSVTMLERRNEQRESLLIAREEKYKKDKEAHGERERVIQGRIDEVEELSQKVSSWMKILEDRDTKMAAKEQRLRRVQTDLVRRSEELLCYRNGRAKQQTRMPPKRTNNS